MADTKLLTRILFALKMGWKHRKILSRYLVDSKLQIKKITDLAPHYLHELEVKVLVLDFDGVLGSDHALVPVDFVKPWLDQMYERYQDKLFVLSNKPLAAREAYLAKEYPRLVFVKGVAKKPYPDGLFAIQQKSGVAGSNILFCDDRLLTGVLAAELAHVRVLWVTQPIKNFVGRFWHEVFFAILRTIDRAFLWVFG